MRSGLDYFEIMRNDRGLSHHNRRGTVFVGGKLYRPLNLLGFELVAANDEVHVDTGKNLRNFFSALGFEFCMAFGNILTRLLKDCDHVETGAGAETHEHEFHRTDPGIFAAGLWWTIDNDAVTAAGLTDEHDIVDPFDSCAHTGPSIWPLIGPLAYPGKIVDGHY